MTTYDLTARRRYSREEKAAIVAESLREGAVSAVARRHRVAPAQLFRWKKEFAPAAGAGETAAAAAQFVPAVLSAAPPSRKRRDPSRVVRGGEAGAAVEIAFPNGCVLRAPPGIGETTLARLVKQLLNA